MKGMNLSRAMVVVLLSVPLMLAASVPVASAKTWTDEISRFSLELPRKWTLEESKVVSDRETFEKQLPDVDFSSFSDDELISRQYKFTNPKEKVSVYIVLSPSVAGMNARQVFDTVTASLPGAGLIDLVPEGVVADLEVNGHPARWGIYRGILEGTSILLFSYVGAVELEKGAISFLIMLSEANRKKLAGTVEKMFKSIR